MILNFIHVPKTAGTSFRKAAEQVYGARRIVYDYNHRSAETSPLVQEFIYEKQAPDPWGLLAACGKSNVAFIGGHFRADKYTPLCGVNNTITFLREPIQRLVSEYRHFVRHNGYKDTLESFYRLPRMQNRMTSILARVPLEALGFLGTTERYSECLALLDQRLCVQLPRREDNVGDRSSNELLEVSDDHRQEMLELNDKDVQLFRRAEWLLEQRLALFNEGKPWVHGVVTETRPRKIAGWAWADLGDAPVDVEIRVNDEVVAVAPATAYVPALARWSVPRAGFVGFECRGSFAVGDKVECRILKTGQLLGGPGRIRQPAS